MLAEPLYFEFDAPQPMPSVVQLDRNNDVRRYVSGLPGTLQLHSCIRAGVEVAACRSLLSVELVFALSAGWPRKGRSPVKFGQPRSSDAFPLAKGQSGRNFPHWMQQIPKFG